MSKNPDRPDLRPARLVVPNPLRSILKRKNQLDSSSMESRPKKRVSFDLPPEDQKAIDYYAKYLYFGPPGGHLAAYEKLHPDTKKALAEECGIKHDEMHSYSKEQGHSSKDEAAGGTHQKHEREGTVSDPRKEKKFAFSPPEMM